MTRKSTKAAAAEPQTGGRKPDFFWDGKPVYRCHLGCGDRYERLDLDAVLRHEREMHPTNARPSSLLGPDGRPLIVTDKE